MSEKKIYNIVILSEQGESYSANKKIIESIKRKGHTFEILHPSKCICFISDSVRGNDAIFYHEEDGIRKINVNSIDAIIPRLANLTFGIPLLRQFSDNLKIVCTQRPHAIATAADKWETHQRLSSNNVRTLKTIFAHKPENVAFLIDKVGGLPAIGKQITGSQGKNVFILETPRAANSAIETMYSADMSILIQQYVEAGNEDIRAIVIDGKVIVAMKRKGGEDFRANISKGGEGLKVTLSQADTQLCINAAAAIGLEMAGVDIIKDAKKQTSYIVEVNSNFGLKVQDITEVSVTDAMVEFIEKRLNEEEPIKAKAMKSMGIIAAKGERLPIKGEMVCFDGFNHETKMAIKSIFGKQ